MAVAILDNPAVAWAAGAQVSPVSYTSGVNNGNTPVNISAGATACFVTIHFQGTTTPGTVGVVWDPTGANQALTQIGSTLVGAVGSVAVFGIVNPTPKTGGAFSITWTGASTRVAIEHTTWTGTATSSVAAAFTNVSTTNTGTAAAPSVAVTGTSGDVCAAFIGDDSGAGLGITLNQTTIYTSTSGRVNGSNYTAASTGSNTLSGTITSGTGTLVFGFDIVAAGAAVRKPSLLLLNVG